MECNYGCKKDKKSKLNKKVQAILNLCEIKPLTISTTCDCKDCRYKGYIVCKENVVEIESIKITTHLEIDRVL